MLEKLKDKERKTILKLVKELENAKLYAGFQRKVSRFVR